jgi:DNA-directed RNA polymerase specialized sigma24 family protein
MSSVAVRLVSLGEAAMGQRELIERAARGERAAFDELYREHVDRVHRHLVHIVGQDPDVEDLVQATFVQVYKNLAKYRGDSSFTTWLYRITVNVALGHLRKRRRAESRHAEDEPAGCRARSTPKTRPRGDSSPPCCSRRSTV